MRTAYELLALALALEDDGLADDEIVTALAAAAEEHVVRLQSAYASTLYLLQETPLDAGAQRLMRFFLQAMQRVAAHETATSTVSVDTAWVDVRDDAQDAATMADRYVRRIGDRGTVLEDARRIQAERERHQAP